MKCSEKYKRKAKNSVSGLNSRMEEREERIRELEETTIEIT